MGKIITLANGQRFLVASVPEVVEALDCNLVELGEWIRDGLLNSCECPTCHFTYPLQQEIDELAQLIEEYPTSVSLQEIVTERFEEQARRRRRTVARVETFGRSAGRSTGPVVRGKASQGRQNGGQARERQNRR